MNLTESMLSKRSPTQNNIYCIISLFKTVEQAKLIESKKVKTVVFGEG